MVTDLGDVCKKVWMNPKELLGILTSDAVQFHWLAKHRTGQRVVAGGPRLESVSKVSNSNLTTSSL
jgi:hypothetical protein